MLRTLPLLASAALLALGTVAPAPAPAAAQQWGGAPRQVGSGSYAGARIWLENDRDSFRRGDRLRVRFSASDDSYVAVIHIDPDGNLDFLYPSSPWDDGYVQRGRVYTPRGGGATGMPVRGQGGIGYFYLIASPVPLDFSSFSGRGGGGWDWSYAGRGVQGDPFWALEQITRLLVPDWRGVPYVSDYSNYYVEGRHRYPSYACGNGYGRGGQGGWGWGWNDSYGSCDRLAGFLRQNPNYYDTRLYRGDRRSRFRGYDAPAPRHGYKERVGERAPDSRFPLRSAEPDRERPRQGTSTAQPRSAPRERAAEPARRKPSLERRESGGSSNSSPRVQSARPRVQPARPRAQPAKEGSRGGAAGGYVRPKSPAPATTPRSRRPAGGGSGG